MANSNVLKSAPPGNSDRPGWVIGLALAMVPCIALCAVFVPFFQFSILYAVPLTLLACYGQLRTLRWLTWVVIALTFITYFAKFWLEPPAHGPQYLSFRIVNRAMVAGMLWLLSKVLGMWHEEEHYRQHPLWSDDFDRVQSRMSTMLGMLIAMPTVVAIALVDGLTPGHFNVAVLYVVPLVTCAWVQSPRLLWTFLVFLQVLTVGGLYWGPPPEGDEIFQRFLQNRILNVGMMFVLTCLLQYWIHSTRNKGGRGRGELLDESATRDGDDERLMVR